MRSGEVTAADVGLCWTCLHKRVIQTPRHSLFFLCNRALSDTQFAKYPRLPVIRCEGHEPAPVRAHSVIAGETRENPPI